MLLMVVVLLAPAVGLSSAPAAAASTDDFTFAKFSAQYTLTRDDEGTAHLQVTETLVAEFPAYKQNKGITRDLNTDYDGVPLNPQVLSVTDAQGMEIPYWTEDGDGAIRVLTGTDDYVTGEQTYMITYTLDNVVRHFDDTDTDEFYWDVNGTGWAQSFGTVEASLVVDDELVASLNNESSCYVGAERATTRCVITETDGAFRASASRIAANQTMTIAVGFDSGTFVIPEVPSRSWWATWLPAGGALAAVAAAVATLIVRDRRWRNAPGRGVIVPEYLPPAGLTVLEGADLVGQPATSFAAQVVDLAVRRAVRIVDTSEPSRGGLFGLSQKQSFSVEFVSDAAVTPPERWFLQIIFGVALYPGQRVQLRTPSSTRAKAFADLVSQTSAAMKARGFREKAPRAMPNWLRWTAGILSVLTGGFVVIIAGRFDIVSGWTVGALIAAIWAFGAMLYSLRRPETLTQPGAMQAEYILGLRMYMELAERDRFAMLQSASGAQRVVGPNGATDVVHLYERLLPWAVLWGIEESWGNQLSIAYQQSQSQPSWYSSPFGFNAVLLGSQLHAFSNAATTASTSPVSSGGGSFSGGAGGGGFAGGGGGGGGGGGR